MQVYARGQIILQCVNKCSYFVLFCYLHSWNVTRRQNNSCWMRLDPRTWLLFWNPANFSGLKATNLKRRMVSCRGAAWNTWQVIGWTIRLSPANFNQSDQHQGSPLVYNWCYSSYANLLMMDLQVHMISQICCLARQWREICGWEYFFHDRSTKWFSRKFLREMNSCLYVYEAL